MTKDKVYQVVYSLETKYPMDEDWWQIWYLLKCPLVGFDSLTQAHQKAKEWKAQLGVKFQPVIIGENEGDFESVDFAALFGINAIGGSDAGEDEFPDFVLEESGCL
jgi:hypothetical protein